MTWLLIALGGARKLVQRVVSFAGTYPWQACVIALLGVSVWLWRGWDSADSRLSDCQSRAAAQQQEYIKAQAEATAAAKQAVAKTESRYKELANEADLRAAKVSVDADRRADDYIRTHSLHVAVKGSADSPVASPENNPSGSSDRPSSETELVEVTSSDIKICTENTVRLEAAHNWSRSLQAASKQN